MDFARANSLQKLQDRLGYSFRDIELMDVALTHTSFAKGDGKAKKHNERLEYLGDAVLELIVSDYIYKNYPKLNEGTMTRVRALVVCENALYQSAVQYGLGECLMLSRGEEHTGGKEKPSILSDAVEAVIGAVYLDGGLEEARKLVLNMVTEYIKNAVHSVNTKDYKTILQEYSQKQHMGNVTYNILSEKGPEHKKVFTLQAVVDGKPMGIGSGGTKQEAGQQAARETLESLQIG